MTLLKKNFHVFLSASLFELAKSIPVHCLKMSSHLFLCLLRLSFTVPCRIVPFAKPEDLQTWPNPLCFSFLTKARSLSYSPSAAWISASIHISAMDYVQDVKKNLISEICFVFPNFAISKPIRLRIMVKYLSSTLDRGGLSTFQTTLSFFPAPPPPPPPTHLPTTHPLCLCKMQCLPVFYICIILY